MFIILEKPFADLLKRAVNTVIREVEPKTLKYRETQLKNEPLKPV